MKKFTLTLLSLILAAAVFGQACDPDPFIQDPEGNGEIAPLDLLPAYTCTSSYNEVITVIVPVDTVLPGTALLCDINSITVDGMLNMPAGFTFACNPATCIFPGGDTTCVSIVGDPSLAAPGVYIVSAILTSNLTCPLLGTFDNTDTVDITFFEVFDCPSCVDPPINPRTRYNYSTSQVELSWSPVQGAAGYRVTAGLSPGPLNKNLSPDIGEFNTDHAIPFGALTEGWVVHWAVVAGCGTPAPPITPFSVEDTFTFSSTPRLAAENALLTQEALEGISAYPNPASDNLLVHINSEIDQNVNIVIYDQLGRIVREQQAQFFTGVNMIRYDISGYDNGLYILEVTSDFGKNVKKFTVAH